MKTKQVFEKHLKRVQAIIDIVGQYVDDSTKSKLQKELDSITDEVGPLTVELASHGVVTEDVELGLRVLKAIELANDLLDLL